MEEERDTNLEPEVLDVRGVRNPTVFIINCACRWAGKLGMDPEAMFHEMINFKMGYRDGFPIVGIDVEGHMLRTIEKHFGKYVTVKMDPIDNNSYTTHGPS